MAPTLTKAVVRATLAIGASTALSIVMKVTVVLVVALVVAGTMRRARASLRHAVLASAFAAILALPVLTLLLPAMQVPIATADADVISLVPAVQQFTPSGDQRAVSAPGDVGTNPPASVVWLLFSVWAIGTGLVFSPVAVALFRLRRIRRTALPALGLSPVVSDLLRHTRIHRQVDVVVHEDILVPMTYGIVRSTIVLPIDADRWSVAESQDALIHELEHIRRWDWLVQLMARAACSVYWFHPLAWMAWRQLTLDAEHACDDAVVQRADGATYAHLLVSLAQRLSARAVIPALSMARRRDLSARVSAILNQEQARGRIGGIPRTVLMSAAIVIAVAVSVLRAVQSPAVAAAPPSPFAPAVAGAKPAFDVASIKESTRDASTGCGRFPYPNRGEFINCTVESSIVVSYRMQRYQLIGAPAWLSSKRFDIIGTTETTFAPQEGLGLIRQLLADRFNLRMHVETQSRPTYVLRFARNDKKLGPHLQENTICTALAAAVSRGDKAPQPSPCQPQLKRALGSFIVQGNQLGTFVRNEFPYLVDRPVVDETGLTAFYDFELTFAPMAAGGSPDLSAKDDRPSIFTAVEEQLGLKLVPETRPVGVMVIDSVSQPLPN